jgi:hypothetical protein
MITPENEISRSLTIISVGYRAHCAEAGCKNLGRLILRLADAGGRPMNPAEFCHAHARVRIEGARAAGLKVYNDRGVGASAGD